MELNKIINGLKKELKLNQAKYQEDLKIIKIFLKRNFLNKMK